MQLNQPCAHTSVYYLSWRCEAHAKQAVRKVFCQHIAILVRASRRVYQRSPICQIVCVISLLVNTHATSTCIRTSKAKLPQLQLDEFEVIVPECILALYLVALFCNHAQSCVSVPPRTPSSLLYAPITRAIATLFRTCR